MASWIALSRTEHANAQWQPRQGYGFAAELQVAEILLPELAKAVPHYALAFVKNQEDYQAVVLLGVGGERNLHVNQQGQWLCPYVPAALRGYPFGLVDSEAGEKVFCIEESHLGPASDALPVFDETGALAEKAAQTLDFLKQCEQGRRATQTAMAALAEADVIEALPLQINRPEGEKPLTIQGLYRINETRLNELDDSAFANLRKDGALLLAYSQLLSMTQIDQFKQKANYLAQEAADTAPADVKSLFNDEVMLNFDLL